MDVDLVVRDADLMLTCAGPAPRSGAAQQHASQLTRATIAARHGRIVFVGPELAAARLLTPVADAITLDAHGCTVIPGFVDAHTHLVFGGDRRDDLRRRLAGASYAEIAATGGGILRTVEATRAATEETLVAASRPRLVEMLRCGTTTCEVKSGYGLTLESELTMLRAMRTLNDVQPIDVVPTFMAAHEVPREYRHMRHVFITEIVQQMLPAVVHEQLATGCDVFCETGVFTPEEARFVLTAAQRLGLIARVHAEEFGPSGGARLAADIGARSADHLLFIDRAGAERLASAGVVATLLPIAAFYLKTGRFAPARLLIEAGVPVALGTDLNAGAGFSPSMPFAIALACFAMSMTLEEALVAATINAAYALDRHQVVGSLEVGKQMDLVVLRGEPTDLVRIGTSGISAVVKDGAIVEQDGEPGTRDRRPRSDGGHTGGTRPYHSPNPTSGFWPPGPGPGSQ